MSTATDDRIELAARRVRRLLDDAGAPLVRRRVLALCSGGVDSVALLLLLDAVSRGAAPAGVEVLWLDHGLRPDAGAELVAARVAAERIGARFHVRRADPGEVDAHGSGTEAAARAWRYARAVEVAHELGCELVATGHTASDQLELALLALVGVTGRGGTVDAMPVLRPLAPGVELVRPLLGLTRDDVIDVCTAAGVGWAEDPTNADADAHVRNSVRHHVVPPLLRAHPGAGASLVRAGERARAASGVTGDLADALLDAWAAPGDQDAATIPAPRLEQLSLAARAELVARWLTRAGVGRETDARRVAAVLGLREGAGLDLPGGTCVRRDGYGLHITQAAPGDAKQ